MESLFIGRISSFDDFSGFFALQLHPVKLKHHLIGSAVAVINGRVCPELHLLVRSERMRAKIKSGFESIGEQPLNKSMVLLQLFIISPPLSVYIINQISIRIRHSSVGIEFDIPHRILGGQIGVNTGFSLKPFIERMLIFLCLTRFFFFCGGLAILSLSLIHI